MCPLQSAKTHVICVHMRAARSPQTRLTNKISPEQEEPVTMAEVGSRCLCSCVDGETDDGEGQVGSNGGMAMEFVVARREQSYHRTHLTDRISPEREGPVTMTEVGPRCQCSCVDGEIDNGERQDESNGGMAMMFVVAGKEKTCHCCRGCCHRRRHRQIVTGE